MERLIRILKEGNHSLVVGGAEVHTYDGRGVSDLFRLSTEDEAVLHGARIADKVVGKGAASIMALSGVREVYADVISAPALEMLQEAGIETTYGRLVPYIVNRERTGMCPLEKRCMESTSPVQAYANVILFMREMKKMRKAV